MHSVRQLPAGYRQIRKLDLQKDKKPALRLNLLALLLALVMGISLHLFIPITTLFDLSRGFGLYFLRLGTLCLGYLLYIIAHEATHAAVMRFFGAKKLRFGFTGLYAFAGSEEDYFDRYAYLRIALAPLLVWGLIFTALCFLVPRDWVWVVYFLLIGNVSGAVGDLYVSRVIAGLPAALLVRDTGVSMTVYSGRQP